MPPLDFERGVDAAAHHVSGLATNRLHSGLGDGDGHLRITILAGDHQGIGDFRKGR